jgi:hypothetical protein
MVEQVAPVLSVKKLAWTANVQYMEAVERRVPDQDVQTLARCG